MIDQEIGSGHLGRTASLKGVIQLARLLSLSGVVFAIVVLLLCSVFYAGEVTWTRVTVSLLCSPELPDGNANSVRLPAILALLILCVSMAVLFQLISRKPDSRILAKTIQISGIGSMVYALLTVTPMHNLMVNIALLFYLVAIAAIVFVKLANKQHGLAAVGLVFIGLKLIAYFFYFTNSYSDLWGLLQKLSFLLTTAWLFAVLWTRPATDP